MTRYLNRTEAGKTLAEQLAGYKGKDCVILALPRGGIPVAVEIARAIEAPIDLLLVRKIGAPGHAELAIGAIVDGEEPTIVVNSDVARMYGLSEKQVREMGTKELAEIERRRALYLKNRDPLPVKDKIAIVVDDGVATGATVKAALKALRQRHPERIVLAVPVAPADSIGELEALADEVVCPAMPSPFYAVGAHYLDFPQVDDSEVAAALASEPSAPKS